MNKEFKLIVAGSPGFNNSVLLAQEITVLVNTTYAEREVSIVSGMAPWRLKVPRLFPWDPTFAALISVSAHPAASVFDAHPCHCCAPRRFI